MATKFYMGAHEGHVGYDVDDKPVHDFFLVRMVTDVGKSRFFQFHESYGKMQDGRWKTAVCYYTFDPNVHKLPCWHLNGVDCTDEITIRYDIMDVTRLVYACRLYALQIPYAEKSPYILTRAFLEICKPHATVQLDEECQEHKPILEAMRTYLEEEKKRGTKMWW